MAERNAPRNEPPRNLLFSPSAFCRQGDGVAVSTSVSTYRGPPGPTAPEGYRPAGAASLGASLRSPLGASLGAASLGASLAPESAEALRQSAREQHGEFASEVSDRPHDPSRSASLASASLALAGGGPNWANTTLDSFFAHSDRGDARGESNIDYYYCYV